MVILGTLGDGNFSFSLSSIALFSFITLTFCNRFFVVNEMWGTDEGGNENGVEGEDLRVIKE